ncbi:MAG: glycosyltransferase, partial [Alkalibacterium sp.]|nr:glycosyltransferase [Alkalibacterium sp.]
SNKLKKNTEENHFSVKIVYAGSVERLKGGAFNAVSTMKYLPTKYTLYVLGHGSENNIKNLKSLIKEVNSQKNYQKVTYLGTMHGDEYSKILTECDIAINPQNVGDYMNTAFPSKVISYLAHNLRVVTTKIISVEKSSIADLVIFVEDDNPQTIAKAIESISLETKYDSSKVIEKLHKDFSNSLQRLLED